MSLRRPPTCGSGSSTDCAATVTPGLRGPRSGPGNRFTIPASHSQNRSDRTQRRLRHTPRNFIPLYRILATELLDRSPRHNADSRCLVQEGENLAHRSGKLVTDAKLSGGGNWAAIKGQTEPGFIIFGPYSPLPKGKYVALFRLRRTDNSEHPRRARYLRRRWHAPARPASASCVPRICR